MKAKIALISLFFLYFFGQNQLFAQPPMRFNKEEAKTLKVGIYTTVLSLTPAEAEKFWPIFNEFEDKLSVLKERENAIRIQVEKDFSTISEAELEKLIDEMMQLHKKESDLILEYYEKYKKVLPIKKVALIHRAEMMYKRALLEKMRGRGDD